MRLRLSIRRHNLPTAELLWAVPDDRAHDAFTVAQLLEHVNDIVPLESPHWGLEDYAVEIGSYEALHFQKAKDIFKDEDQVCIRHLTQTELRARHIAGRDQINANGQHLIDGIPFGKSYFSARRPGRPAVNIPPLKNPIAESTDGDELHALLGDQYRIDDDDDDEHDENFAAEQPARKRRRLESVKSDKSDRSVHFQDDNALVALPSDDDTEYEYHAAPEDALSSSSISDSSSDVSTRAAPVRADTKTADADDSWTSSSDSDSDSEDTDSSSDVSSSDEVSLSEDSSSDDDDSDNSSDSDSTSSDEDDSDSSSEPDEVSSKPPAILAQASAGNQNEAPKPTRPPYQGLERTKARNRRRRLGKLHKSATLQGAGKRPAVPRTPQRTDIDTASSHQTEREAERLNAEVLEEKKAALLAMLNIPTSEISNPEKNIPTDADSTLTDAKTVEGEGVDAGTKEDEPAKAGEGGPGEKAQKPAANAVPETATETTQKATNEVTDVSAPKRKRIDVGSFRRLTMGSLGLRTPKNKEEEQKLRDKIAANVSGRSKKKLYGEASTQEEEEPEDLQDPDAWKSRVELMAFEVSDENVQQLSAPPFPFKQRWDPQQYYEPYEEYDQQYEPKKKNKKKRKRDNQTYDEPEQHYEADGNENWGILDYDEPAEADAAQSQLLQETQDAQSMSGAQSKQRADEQTSVDDDLPSLPSDVTTLQQLVAQDICTGSIVVYKEMEVSELTGWQPIISDYRRAKVLGTEEDAVYLQLAALDVPRKQSDTRSGINNGKLESKTFDVTEEEEEEDPSRRWVEFPNIAELWLLQAAPSDEAEGLADAQMVDGNGEGSAASETDAHANGTVEENPGEGTTEAHSPDEKGEDAVAEN